MEKKFEMETTLTFEESYKFSRIHYNRELKKKKMKEFQIVILIIFIILSFIDQSFRPIIIGLCCLLFINLMLLLMYHFLKKQSKKLFDSYKIAHDAHQQFVFYDDYYTITTSNSNANIKYNELYEVVSTSDNYYLYIANRLANVIRKSDIKDEKKFNEFIKEKVGKKYIEYKG